jgi:hypothetical protein
MGYIVSSRDFFFLHSFIAEITVNNRQMSEFQPLDIHTISEA